MQVYLYDDGLPPQAAAIRRAVFMDEQGFRDEFDDLDHTCWHLLCEENGNPMACARIFPEEGDCWHIGRVAVCKECRGTGLGAAVMAACHQKIAELGGRRAVLSAQEQAVGFYEKQGYRVTSESYLDQHCPHRDMERPVAASEI